MNNMKKLCWILSLVLLLSGCSQRVELAAMAVCLGVDAGAEGVTLTIKAPDYSGGKQGEQNGYATLTGRGADWTRAVADLYAHSPAMPQFGQLREIVIGEGTFDTIPPKELFVRINSLPSLRVHALVTVCPGSAAEMIRAMKPEIGKRMSKYLDITLRYHEQQGTIPATSLGCALRDLTGPWRDPVLAYWDGDAAGGYALGDRGAMLLSGREVKLLRLLRGESQDYLLEVGGQYLGVQPRGRAKRRIEGGALMLEVPVYLTYSLYDEPPQPAAEDALRDAVQALLRRLQEAGCDALGFGCEAVRGYGTLESWLQSEWTARYRGAAIRIKIDSRPRQQPLL